MAKATKSVWLKFPISPETDRPKTRPFHVESPIDPGNHKGKRAENRFTNICRQFVREFPVWLFSIYRGTPADDADGVDFWARTLKTGLIGLDVKSSVKALKARKKKGREHIVPILVPSELTDREVFDKAIADLAAHRNRMLAAKTKTGT